MLDVDRDALVAPAPHVLSNVDARDQSVFLTGTAPATTTAGVVLLTRRRETVRS